jgi:hypothetical protein
LWLDQSFTLYLSHLTIDNIITVVPPITACASSYDYQLLPQTHNLDMPVPLFVINQPTQPIATQQPGTNLHTQPVNHPPKKGGSGWLTKITNNHTEP